jgi:hypothetical protein
MMAWQSEPVEQAPQDWHSRSVKKRAELSISIEEALADDTLAEGPFSDELDKLEEPVQESKRSVIIPPRLSLQSKAMPVVRVEPGKAIDVTVVDSRSTTDSVVVPQASQKKRRLAGRTTKVHLQAVPKSEKKAGGKISIETEKNVRSIDGEVQSSVKSNAKRGTASETGALVEGQVRNVANGSLAGSGVFKKDQAEAVVAHAHISASSVIVVTLVGDPGPVVVKYITLQPRIGFTVHLSAPAEAETPFNYVILMGELF